jgi:hypothetical protein
MTLNHVSTNDPHVTAHNDERDQINANADAIDNRIVKPNAPKVGDMLTFDGTNWVGSRTRLFEGEGQPEGVLAAPIGSRYVDVTGLNGAVEWLKVRGASTDNTGWILSATSDTGWRNVLGTIVKPAGSAAYVAMIRRIGNMVDVHFDLDTPASGTSWNFYTLPVGFRPKFVRPGLLQDNSEAAGKATSVSSAGVCNIQVIVNKRDRWNGQWFTDDAWPAALPGTAG